MIRFVKMHGLGNDFMVIDARDKFIDINTDLIRTLSHRNYGVGFDQLAILYKSKNEDLLGDLRFWNADGSETTTCGNATRCVASLLSDETDKMEFSLSTRHSDLKCRISENGMVSVNMGEPKVEWKEIPLANCYDTNHLPIDGDPIATNFGNPHCTFFVNNIDHHQLEKYGKFETNELFPEKTNVQVAQVIQRGKIRVRVWERGVGPTLSSGSSSCAVAIAAYRRGLSGKKNQIILDGGELNISWQDDGVWMSGEVIRVFDGTISERFLRENN